MGRLEELVERRARLDARIKEMQERAQAREREARERSLAALGRAVVARLGGDWRAVDYAAVDAWLAESGEGLRARLTREPAGVEDALRAAEAMGPGRRRGKSGARTGCEREEAGDE